MHRSIRRTALAGVAVASLSLVGACGSNDAPDRASDTSTTDDSQETSAVADLEPGAALPAVDAKSLMTAASADLTSLRIEADTAMGAAGTMHMEGVEQIKPSLEAQMTMSVAGQDMEFRMIGSDMYVQMPAAAAIPGGKKWITMSFDDIGKLSGMDTSALGDTLQNPAAGIDKYAKFVTGGTYVGPATIDGVETKQYDFTMDAKALGAEIAPDGLPSAAGSFPDAIHESVWIDEDGHPVQMKMEMGELGTTTLHMSDFGTEVDVPAPPKDEIADLSELMQGGLAAG